jgi:hypothetical protein
LQLMRLDQRLKLDKIVKFFRVLASKKFLSFPNGQKSQKP